MYRILLADDEHQAWHDLAEGPWDTACSALRYAETEVGVPWIVVDANNRPVGFGDRTKVVWSLLDPPLSRRREPPAKLFFLEVQYTNVREADRFDWADPGEGPFDSAEEAIRFAEAECGLPWRVVDEDFEDNHVEYGTGNEDRPPAAPPPCPACKTNNCEPGGGKWWCIDCGMEF